LAKSPRNNQKRIASPCRSLCQLNAQNVCTGCHRTATEISFWTTMTEAEKRRTLARLTQRRKQAESSPT